MHCAYCYTDTEAISAWLFLSIYESDSGEPHWSIIAISSGHCILGPGVTKPCDWVSQFWTIEELEWVFRQPITGSWQRQALSNCDQAEVKQALTIRHSAILRWWNLQSFHWINWQWRQSSQIDWNRYVKSYSCSKIQCQIRWALAWLAVAGWRWRSNSRRDVGHSIDWRMGQSGHHTR